MFAAGRELVVVSRDFCRKRLIINQSNTEHNATATNAVRDTDKPATCPRDSSFPAATGMIPVTSVYSCFLSSLCFDATLGGCVPNANNLEDRDTTVG